MSDMDTVPDGTGGQLLLGMRKRADYNGKDCCFHCCNFCFRVRTLSIEHKLLAIYNYLKGQFYRPALHTTGYAALGGALVLVSLGYNMDCSVYA